MIRVLSTSILLLLLLSMVSFSDETDCFVGVEPLKDAWQRLEHGLWTPDTKSDKHLLIPPSNRESVLDIVYRDEGDGSVDLIIKNSNNSQIEKLNLPLTGTNTLRVESIEVPPHQQNLFAKFLTSKKIKVKMIAVSSHDRNTFFPLPDEIKAVKFDPWCSKSGWGELNSSELVHFWKDCGFNAIFIIVQNRTRSDLFSQSGST